MTASLLRLKEVGKTYPATVSSSARLSAFWQILIRGRSNHGSSVLESIDFEVWPGESLAIIGANGAGKSTLLKVITGVLAPSSGTIQRNGSQAALLELGAGFDPEYTGLENLRMNAAFLGLGRKEVDEKLDDILAFADIGESIHEPIKHYSSGMVVRLGFAVVAAVTPDLLITDEVLAVGDESFQKKCIRWIETYLGNGGTLLMVSHNMYQVQKLCRHALWLDHGKARAIGDVFEVTQSYLAWHERKDQADRDQVPPSAALPYVEVFEIVDPPGDVKCLGSDQDLMVHARFRTPGERPPVVQFGLVRVDGTPVFGISSDEEGVVPSPAGPNLWAISLWFSALKLLPGDYYVRVCALDVEGLRACDTREVEFSVRYTTRQAGLVRLDYQWCPVQAPESGQAVELSSK